MKKQYQTKVGSNISSASLLVCGLLFFTALSSLVLTSTHVSADNNTAVDEVDITVPVACTMTGSVGTNHTATLTPGTYSGTSTEYANGIGKTTLTTFCNDNNGFSIYTIGYTGNTDGTNTLVGTNTGATINTKAYESTDTQSNWSMKVNKVTDSSTSYNPQNMTITNSFDNYHAVPNDYVQVAEYKSTTEPATTDTTLGAKVETTYAAYVATNQPADTYTGKVKYVMVHPYDHEAPIANPATLDEGRTVNSKLKSLAATVINGEETTITPTFNPNTDSANSDSYIKSINVHLKTSAPAGFTPSENNTISASDSQYPIYIIFDNTNDAGIMHFYTEGWRIILPTDSSFMFYNLNALASIPGISEWSASNVTNMSKMFNRTGYSASTFTLDLSSWNTSSVTTMEGMFANAGQSATTWSVGNLSSWNTANVTNMIGMFASAGYSANTFTLNLSSWNTSSVTGMNSMFANAGHSADTVTLNISSWNTSNVTNMSYLFASAGQSANTFTTDVSSWNTSNVTDMSGMFYFAGQFATTWSIGDLSSWNTSSVTSMTNMFCYSGYSATTWSIGDLSSWNTSNVTNMTYLFASAGFSANTVNLDLSSWDTSKVTDMTAIFNGTGYSATTFTLDLSSWDTSHVTNMFALFSGAGDSATTWSITIPVTNGNGISNTTNHLYGQTTSTYANPDSNKAFTLAQL